MAKKGVLLSRPKDKSLESFKAWVDEITMHLLGRTDPIPEDKWKELWTKFWSS